MKKFNPNKDMRIQNVKAHVTYRKPNKKKEIQNQIFNKQEGFAIDTQPSEFNLVSGLQGGKQKPKLTKEKIFDIKGDGKPFQKKKESKVAKEARAFYMVNGVKEFHEK